MQQWFGVSANAILKHWINHAKLQKYWFKCDELGKHHKNTYYPVCQMLSPLLMSLCCKKTISRLEMPNYRKSYTLFQNGGCLRWSGSSCMKTRHRGPNVGVYKCFYRSRYAVMPQNSWVPECKKKVYVKNGVKISFHIFPEEKKLWNGSSLFEEI